MEYCIGNKEVSLMKYIVNSDRISLIDDEKKELAFVEFPEFEDGKVEVTHTVVDSSLRGKGIAGTLTQKMADHLRTTGQKAELTCSYAVKWFAAHKEYSDVLINPEAEYEKAKTMQNEACQVPKHQKK